MQDPTLLIGHVTVSSQSYSGVWLGKPGNVEYVRSLYSLSIILVHI